MGSTIFNVFRSRLCETVRCQHRAPLRWLCHATSQKGSAALYERLAKSFEATVDTDQQRLQHKHYIEDYHTYLKSKQEHRVRLLVIPPLFAKDAITLQQSCNRWLHSCTTRSPPRRPRPGHLPYHMARSKPVLQLL
jgi:hypothetical protein